MHGTIRRAACAAAAVTVIATAAACGGGGDSKASPSTMGATVPATQTTAPTASTAPAATVKLSTTWGPKLSALGTGNRFDACTDSASSPTCVAAMTDSLTTLTGVLRGIAAANATAEYQQTVTDINDLVKVATAYENAGCATDPSADSNGACFKNAMDIRVGVSRVGLDLVTDERTAGAS